MSLLHVLLLVAAITINIPWFLVIRRRGRIASHSKSRLRSFAQKNAGVEEADEHMAAGVGKTLKTHVRSGLLCVSHSPVTLVGADSLVLCRTKLQPHHLPLLFLYTCSLYILTRPDLGRQVTRLFSIGTSSSVAAVSKSILPSWLTSHLPEEFPFAVPDKDDLPRSRDHAKSPLLEPQLLSQAGQALISILSMVTGLLLSYKSSSALGKWEKGKGVWIGAGAGAGGMSGGVKGEIRSAVRMVCDDRGDEFSKANAERRSL